MFAVSELARKVKNIVRITTIITPNETKALATVRVGADDESIEFPVLGFANSFKRHNIPVRAGEQVLIVHPFGNANKGYIFRGIFYKNLKEPKGANNHTEIVVFEDGTRMEYNSKKSILKMDIKGDTEITCNNLSIKSKRLIIESENIKLSEEGELEITGELIAAECNLSLHKHTTNCSNPKTREPCTKGSGDDDSTSGSSLSDSIDESAKDGDMFAVHCVDESEQSQVNSNDMESSAEDGDLFAVKCVES